MSELLYTVDKECPLCQATFPVTKVRSKLQMIKQDGDFCTYYKELNPNYYVVWVCPHCGYAAQDTYFYELSPAAEMKLKQFLHGREVNLNLSGVRTREQGMAAFKLAIFYAEMIAAPPSRLAGLYLKLAWLYREAEQAEEEKILLNKARANYEQATLKERFPIGNMTEITVDYLIGELYRRTGNYDQALSYLGKVVSNPRAKLERRILDMAKEAWHDAREQRKKANAGE
ncbi:MAG: DUF2225 domain-containing protein [Negativicutes bacterium]|nr:DUF2225 domain-containing protein [Negativicutes bacterium]